MSLRQVAVLVSSYEKTCNHISPEQVAADLAAAEAWRREHGVKMCQPGTADHAVSIYVPMVCIPTAKLKALEKRTYSLKSKAKI